MNHQPFRDWLLSEEKLSADQAQALQGHLDSCEPCRQIETAWLDVESALHKSPQVTPAPGFTTRWQSHLIEYQLNKQRRRVWMTIGLTASIVTILLGLLVTIIWSVLQTPDPFIASLFNRLISLVAIYYTVQDIFHAIIGVTPAYSFIVLFFFVGIISFMSVLWLSAYRKISMAWRSA